jgi:hypothetical protein
MLSLSARVLGGVRGNRSAALISACLLAITLGFATTKASGAVAWHHGFSVPLGTPAEEESWGEAVTGAMGSSDMRIPLSWDAYQTGPNQYNQAALDHIVSRVQHARGWSPYPFHPGAIVIFELPDSPVPWMQAAGYQMTAGEGNGHPRYYPASLEGQKAYGRAMGKALKYLSDVQIAWGIETPNEPNLKNGPAQAVPAEYIGRLGAYGILYANVEGVPILSPGAPTVLVGSVSTNPDTANASEGKTPVQYIRQVQTSADFWIDSWYAGTPNGPSTANLVKGAWRASFHAYPKLGSGEAFPCQRISTPQGQKLQDELGDLTGEAAFAEATKRLYPALEVLDEVPWKKRWWLTETGMSSYKSNINNETFEHCITRRANGGSAYGKEQQRMFYQELGYAFDVNYKFGWYPWSSLEGVTFFAPLDTTYAANDPFKGFGAFSPGCGNYCWKPAGIYFADTF